MGRVRDCEVEEENQRSNFSHKQTLEVEWSKIRVVGTNPSGGWKPEVVCACRDFPIAAHQT